MRVIDWEAERGREVSFEFFRDAICYVYIELLRVRLGGLVGGIKGEIKENNSAFTFILFGSSVSCGEDGDEGHSDHFGHIFRIKSND